MKRNYSLFQKFNQKYFHHAVKICAVKALDICSNASLTMEREGVEENGDRVFSCTVELCSEIIPAIKTAAFVCGRASDVNKDEPCLSHVYLEGAAAFLKNSEQD